MNEPQIDRREKIKQLVAQSLAQSDPTAWFEMLYADSQGDANQVPWAKLTPHPYLQDWLINHTPPGEQPSALVIGCGLGDDAQALATAGYQVTAFDISPTAIAWCQKRFPETNVNYLVADLLAIPYQWQQAFDLVFESRNIQALPVNIRSQVIQSVASLVAPGGTLLVITGFRETEAEPDGPPWFLSQSELAMFAKMNFTEVNKLPFLELERLHLRIEYQLQTAN
jgi:SAM-dependent methyltransferase